MVDYSPVTPPAADHECPRCRVALVPGYAYVEPPTDGQGAAFKVGRLRSNPSIGGAVPLERGGMPAQPG